jgi:hypothetical protein
MNFGRVGWVQVSSQNSHPATFCFATAADSATASDLTKLTTNCDAAAEPPLREEWQLADRVRAASVTSPTDARHHVAWRRLAREMRCDANELRARWAAAGHAGSTVLPLLEPWEMADGLIKGAADGTAVQLAVAVGGADDVFLTAGIVETASGAAYELGAPSDQQIEAWRQKNAGISLAASSVDLGWVQSATGMVAAPTALAAIAVGAGVLTHHLQVHIFVI